LNIDKYFVCESRDMSDESNTYIILLKLKTILYDTKNTFISPMTSIGKLNEVE
jgi:hypothetical protein